MKRTIITTICITLVACLCMHSEASNPIDELSQDDRRTLENAIMLIDGGMAEAALEDFDILLKRHPDNYLVLYEHMYALYHLGRYKEIVKDSKKLLNHPDVDAIAFQMCGNVMDITGKSKKAEKIYREGLARFPESGPLYLELGNLRMARQEYREALKWYIDGIVAAPNFASNYYRAALMSSIIPDCQTWALIMAETEILLAPSNEMRHMEMSDLIRLCLCNNIRKECADSSWTADVSLVPGRGIIMDQTSESVQLAFEGVYECCAAASAVR
ncbi:MAG: hypothetical protein K2H03_03430, partial [Muribaculaceae bacterium]|nr:hypothetical protein [Muribaculaceae bacterium]